VRSQQLEAELADAQVEVSGPSGAGLSGGRGPPPARSRRGAADCVMVGAKDGPHGSTRARKGRAAYAVSRRRARALSAVP
jgi:hypothetical protein